MIIIDTNVLLRYMAGDVPTHMEAARMIFEKIGRGDEQGIIIHTVIHEACYTLTSSTPGQGYNLTHKDTRDRLFPIIENENIQVVPDKQIALQALDIFASSEKIDYTDALLVAYVRNGYATRLYSFEKRFGKIEGANWTNPLNSD